MANASALAVMNGDFRVDDLVFLFGSNAEASLMKSHLDECRHLSCNIAEHILYSLSIT